MKELVDYFIRETNEKFDKLDDKVNQLLEFKWKVVGSSIGVSLVITAVFQIGFFIYKQ